MGAAAAAADAKARTATETERIAEAFRAALAGSMERVMKTRSPADRRQKAGGALPLRPSSVLAVRRTWVAIGGGEQVMR
jgi:hypothetical protein